MLEKIAMIAAIAGLGMVMVIRIGTKNSINLNTSFSGLLKNLLNIDTNLPLKRYPIREAMIVVVRATTSCVMMSLIFIMPPPKGFVNRHRLPFIIALRGWQK